MHTRPQYHLQRHHHLHPPLQIHPVTYLTVQARPTDTATEDAPRALRTHSEVVPPPTVTSPVVTFANATAAPNLQPDNGQGAYIA
eukprot:CAMPEP_0174710676 /NCGR_PEP_ID=MMETSP1094-20130205/12229_1 /TAXON_ID=156173 /ORGANISM="Chrysochromulina brevifilum, Strain UTEX LB 985" /LENGTH=84 /DNA_ID=CAMNT_0015909505 /DNA_START=252 /DNA_END=506 /DNA_ORIENTATION=-